VKGEISEMSNDILDEVDAETRTGRHFASQLEDSTDIASDEHLFVCAMYIKGECDAGIPIF
jgi:hypothetical protein